MKKITAAIALCILGGGLLSLVSWQSKPTTKDDAPSEAVMDLGIVDLPKDQAKKSRTLTARNPKLSKSIQQATHSEMEALEAMKGKNPNFTEIADMLWDEDIKPDAYTVELRKKRGDPNPYAPIGPSSKQIYELFHHGTIDGKPVPKRTLTDEEKEWIDNAVLDAKKELEAQTRPKRP